MNCASCGSTISADARFCAACGALVAVDPDQPPATPAHLAARIRADRHALEGERKQVTILFADIADSMQLAKGIDPEDWRSIMDRCFQLLAIGVHAFEGTVDKFTGDGIMAIFGAPLAHEDHARRACLAALEMKRELTRLGDELRESHGIELGVRLGLNSGEVVVGSIGERGDMAYTAIGHTVGLAQRMEELAEPGQICLSEATAALIRGYFELGGPVRHDVRGAGSVEVHTLERARETQHTFAAATSRGLTRFIGREQELGALESAFEAGMEGRGELVGIVGEPGIGKSRLCHELAERCRAQGIPVFQVAAEAHARNLSLQPVLALLREYFGITDADSDELAREKIADRLDLLGGELERELALVCDFLGVPDPDRPVERMDPEARHRRLLDFVRRLIHAQSAHEPALTVFEDLQWIDPASEAFLLAYVEAVQGTRGLTVISFRPDYGAAWMSRSFYRQIPLRPLLGEDEQALVTELLGPDPSLTDAARLIARKAKGNPFFAEELVRSFAESGSLRGSHGAYELAAPIDEADIPATVQAVIAARIDRLAPDQKAVLEAAAVIGKEFSEPLLADVTGLAVADLEGALRALVAAEFVVEHLTGAEPAYEFSHPLTLEVAYNSQLRERRQAVHAAVAKAIIETDPERLDEQAALIARHWERAGEALESARWHARAATWSGYNDPGESVRHWRLVADLADELPESEEVATLGLVARVATLHFGWRLGLSGEEAERVFNEAEQMAASAGDPRWRVALLGGYGAVKGLGQGQVGEYARLARDAIALAEEADDPTLLLPPNAYAFHLSGDIREGMDVLDRAIAAAGGDPTVGAGVAVACPYALCLSQQGLFLTLLGELEAGRNVVEEGRAVARDHGDPETVGINHGIASILEHVSGNGDRAFEHGRQAVETGERIGGAFSRVWAWTDLGVAQNMRGEWKGAIESVERAIEIADAHRTAAEGRAYRLAHLAEAHLGAGDHQLALELADQASVVAEAQGGPVAVIPAGLAMGRVLLAAPGPLLRERIEAELASLLRYCDEVGARGYEPMVRIELSQLARRLGDEKSARREHEEARRLFELNGAVGHIERLGKARDRVGAGGGR